MWLGLPGCCLPGMLKSIHACSLYSSISALLLPAYNRAFVHAWAPMHAVCHQSMHMRVFAALCHGNRWVIARSIARHGSSNSKHAAVLQVVQLRLKRLASIHAHAHARSRKTRVWQVVPSHGVGLMLTSGVGDLAPVISGVHSSCPG